MTPSDEQELHRLSTLLAEISATLPPDSPRREGLVKAGLALSLAFIQGRRPWLEETHAQLQPPLTPEQRTQLQSLNIDLDPPG